MTLTLGQCGKVPVLATGTSAVTVVGLWGSLLERKSYTIPTVCPVGSEAGVGGPVGLGAASLQVKMTTEDGTFVSRLESLKTLGAGLICVLETDEPYDQVLERMMGRVESPLASELEGLFRSGKGGSTLTGKVRDNNLRLCLPTADRRPWWRLSPVFHGHIEPAGTARTRLIGRLRIRLHVILGVLVLASICVFVPGSDSSLFSWKIVPLSLVLTFMWDVVFALPRTTAALETRIERIFHG